MESAFLLLRYDTGQPAAVYRFDGLTRDEVGHVLAALHKTCDRWLNALSVEWAADVDVPTRMRRGLELAEAKEADAANWLRPNTGNAHDARKAAASFEQQIREVRTGSESVAERNTRAPKMPTVAAPPALPNGEALTDDHDKILAVLAKTPTKCKTVIDVAGDGPIRSRETVGRLMTELARGGLVERPYGKRKGYAITDAGRKRLPGASPT